MPNYKLLKGECPLCKEVCVLGLWLSGLASLSLGETTCLANDDPRTGNQGIVLQQFTAVSQEGEAQAVGNPRLQITVTGKVNPQKLEELEKAAAEKKQTVRLIRVGPGTVLEVEIGGEGEKRDVSEKVPAEAEGDEKKAIEVTSVAITRVAGEPATITVKVGDKEWTVKEDKIGELPQEIRALVEKHRELIERWAKGDVRTRELMFNMRRPEFRLIVPSEIMERRWEEWAKKWGETQKKQFEEAMKQHEKLLERWELGSLLREPPPASNLRERLERVEKQLEQLQKAIQELTEELRKTQKTQRQEE